MASTKLFHCFTPNPIVYRGMGSFLYLGQWPWVLLVLLASQWLPQPLFCVFEIVVMNSLFLIKKKKEVSTKTVIHRDPTPNLNYHKKKISNPTSFKTTCQEQTNLFYICSSILPPDIGTQTHDEREILQIIFSTVHKEQELNAHIVIFQLFNKSLSVRILCMKCMPASSFIQLKISSTF